MWLNDNKISTSAISHYRKSLLDSCPHHIVVDGLFNEERLDEVAKVISQTQNWKTQRHTYSALYVDNAQWQKTSQDQQFVQRDAWLRKTASTGGSESKTVTATIAEEFLSFLRGGEFMSVLSRIFNVHLTDIHVDDPAINSNYFRLGASDFVNQHVDDSPGREVCLLLYLNKHWNENAGGELCFKGSEGEGLKPDKIAPLYNRCILFDPSSKGSEHWVEKLNADNAELYRYNVTSWYWSK